MIAQTPPWQSRSLTARHDLRCHALRYDRDGRAMWTGRDARRRAPDLRVATANRRTGKPMTYTHGHHESVLRSHKWRTVDNSAAYLAPHLTIGTSVVDLGCGPGTITADIGRRVAPGRVLGIDASAAVIEEARRDAGGGPNVECLVG